VVNFVQNRNEKARHKAGLFNMAHSSGFEPLTARFVAEYSIQLSYECVFPDVSEAANYREIENVSQHRQSIFYAFLVEWHNSMVGVGFAIYTFR
jgi:hypothetical protein